MKLSIKAAATLSVFSAVTASAIILSANPAAAQVRGMQGTYVGGGGAAGVTDGGEFGGNIQGRFDVPVAPVSLRGAVLFTDETSAIMPILSFDYGVAPNTNIYAGAGYSFVERDGRNSPLGNTDSVVLTTGVETAVQRNIVLYGDVKLGLDAFQNETKPAVSFQVGAGYRF